MPEWLTRKVGPLPMWGYGAIGVAIFFVYRMRKSQSAASTAPGASANYTANTSPWPTESVTTPSGFSYTGPAGGGEYYIPQGAMSTTSSTTNSGVSPFDYSSEPFQGAGYNTPSGGAGAPIPGLSGGSYQWLPSQQAVQAAQANQTPIYYQPTPGNFQAIGPGFNQWANTPIFEKAA